MVLRYILMGDIIKSREYDATQLRRKFLRLVSSCNETLTDGILSPYTVTLGDEFQGVASSLGKAIEAIFHMEETAFLREPRFRIRYVTVYGAIDTPINPTIAHTMMGSGLARAREMLTNRGRTPRRFRFHLGDAYLDNQLNRLFSVIDGLSERWRAEDARLILDMLHNTNNRDVGAIHAKNRSQIWKRRNYLLIEEYRAVKETIVEMAQQK
uniref:SatD family (SatD) n=1 Tax=Candidatus Kentrum sp. DK TaxID=2126562 RepID=A0A450SU61_9GAMM|nr:MAG: SatD family (SatD) [Candidatus Kentron sp. DK]